MRCFDVLVVDDDLAIREVVRELLEGHGLSVETSPHGADALSRLGGGERPAVILLDLAMPALDGRTTLARLREDAALRSIPVVVVTGEHQDVPCGVPVVAKPVDGKRLLDIVRRALAGAA